MSAWTNQLHLMISCSCLLIINILLTELSQSAQENLDLTAVVACVQKKPRDLGQDSLTQNNPVWLPVIAKF